MPRKFLTRLMPTPHKIRASASLKILGEWLHDPNVWHLNRRSASLAFLVGLFCAFLPIPIQMLVAATIAVIVHCNLPLAVALVWITNPFTMGPIFYGAYKIGAFILQTPVHAYSFALSWEWLSESFINIWKPLLLGSLLCGISSGLVGYFTINWLWRRQVVKRWQTRVQERADIKAGRIKAPKPTARQ